MVDRRGREPTRWERFKEWARWQWESMEGFVFLLLFLTAFFLFAVKGDDVMDALLGEPEACTLPAQYGGSPWDGGPSGPCR